MYAADRTFLKLLLLLPLLFPLSGVPQPYGVTPVATKWQFQSLQGQCRSALTVSMGSSWPGSYVDGP